MLETACQMWSARAATSAHASEASRVLRVISGQIQPAKHWVIEIPYDTSSLHPAEDDSQTLLRSQYEENQVEPLEALALGVTEALQLEAPLTEDMDWVGESLDITCLYTNTK